MTKHMGPFLRCTQKNLQVFDKKVLEFTHSFKTKSFDNHNTQGTKTKFHIFKIIKIELHIYILTKPSFRFLNLISNEMEKNKCKVHTL
jgi:hypothetical protein